MKAAAAHTVGGVGALASARSVWLCDVWGVIHNGVERFDAAVEALERFRRRGGTVALITNAPRPAASVEVQLAELGITRRAYDLVVTSGDVTRRLVAASDIRKVFHLGPDRDAAFFAGLGVERVDIDAAEAVICTGLFDDVGETPGDYEALFGDLIGRRLTLYCANPDRVVRRGEKLFYCAGALADLYRTMGGSVIVAGKPNPPIYREALDRIARVRGSIPGTDDMLVIGDGIETDMAGAAGLGASALFVTGGIHADELRSADVLERLDAVAGLRVAGVLPALCW